MLTSLLNYIVIFWITFAIIMTLLRLIYLVLRPAWLVKIKVINDGPDKTVQALYYIAFIGGAIYALLYKLGLAE